MNITNLTGTTWTFHDSLPGSENTPSTARVRFESSGEMFISFSVGATKPNPPTTMTYVRGVSDQFRAYDPRNYQFSYNRNWLSDSYRTIKILGGEDVTNSTLIQWLQDSAVLVSYDLTGTAWLLHEELFSLPQFPNLYNDAISLDLIFPNASDESTGINWYRTSSSGDYITKISIVGSPAKTVYTLEDGWIESPYRLVYISGGYDVIDPATVDFFVTNGDLVDLNIVTFEIVNGTWSDGTKSLVTKWLTGGTVLDNGNISTPGDPDPGYALTGKWTPQSPYGVVVNSNLNFTYTFDVLTHYTVTYNVVNGTWADGSTNPIHETVLMGTSPVSIPEGMVSKNYYFGLGSWNADPQTAVITEDTTFTYTFKLLDVKYTKWIINEVLESGSRNTGWTLYIDIESNNQDFIELVLGFGLDPEAVFVSYQDKNGNILRVYAPTQGIVDWIDQAYRTITLYENNTDTPSTTDQNFIKWLYENAQLIEVGVIYDVVNGTWSDGTTTKQVYMTPLDDPTPPAPQGMLPSPGYRGGSWDKPIGPFVSNYPLFYTYEFDPIPSYICYIYHNGSYNPAIPYVYHNGSYTEVIPYIY